MSTILYPTKQDVFNKVWQHFIVEKNPAGYDAVAKRCVYDTPSGGCAVGCLVPSDVRPRLLPATTPAYGPTMDLLRPFLGPEVSQDFLLNLQVCHDNSVRDMGENGDFHTLFEKRLRQFAINHDLKTP